ncbi:PqqD family protein [Desulfogranum marinum]|uniref:PqqD family protein n=1 Tax=Desulfogranum marinum TaxID=453220 RepID=UPI00196238C2|nr:PqqD family protein [Desulfogranum marinum]MBM9511717.1 PqqD family protein [Desulfogranum marinum]
MPQPLSRKEALECIPLQNPRTEEEENQEGLLLTYPVEVKPFFHTLVKRVTGKDTSNIRRKIQLDQMGSSVWQLIDGQRSVRDIATNFQHRHQLDNRESEISVTSFLKELGKRGLVAMKQKD